MGRLMVVSRTGLAADHPVQASVQVRFDRVMELIETRLREVPYFAGSEFTAADIMSVFSLTTMRLFQPVSLGPYPGILICSASANGRLTAARWLRAIRISSRCSIEELDGRVATGLPLSGRPSGRAGGACFTKWNAVFTE